MGFLKFMGWMVLLMFFSFMFVNYQIGTKTSYYDNGEVQSIQHFDEEGFLVDSAVYYYDDGSLAVRVFFEWGGEENKRRIKSYTGFFKDGTIASEYSATYYYKIAMLKRYTEVGHYGAEEHLLKSTYRFGNNGIEGVKKDFNEFSKVIKESFFTGSKIISTQTLKKELNLKMHIGSSKLYWDPLLEADDLDYHTKISYHDLGDQQGGMKSDLRTDIATGNTKERIFSKKGVMQSIKVWDGSYYSSSLNREKRYYYENGQLQSEIKFINGMGEYVSYYQNGNVESKGGKVLSAVSYSHSSEEKMDGEWKYYNRDGALSYRFYVAGEPTTDSNYYY